MTPDASLPPAGVQRPTPPLTEEELATLLELDVFAANAITVRRLIADLRASRAEVAALRVDRDYWRESRDEAIRASRAEVERLKAEVEHWRDGSVDNGCSHGR